MENNDHDGKYGWICAVWTMGMILSSVCLLDTGKMNRLAMPVDSDGNVCGEEKPYLWVEPEHRTCQVDCVDEVMMELGGICLSEVNKYLLQMSGQWQQLLNKQLTLQIYHAIFCSIFLSLLIALLLLFLAYFIRPLPYLLIGINSIAILLLTYLLRDYYHLCVGFLLLALAYYVYVVRVVLCQNTPSSPPPTLPKPLAVPMLCSVGMVVLGVVVIVLCLLEYMCMLSSQPLTSSPSNIFSSINTLTYKEMMVIVHTYYLMHLLSCLYNYLIGGYYSTERQSLDMGRICGHFGSICKMAFIRSIFILPISILYWWKASEGEACVGCCHWTCGCLLNFSRRYSLPVLPYMYATNSVAGLSVSARHLSAEWHLQKQSATSSILPSSLSFLFFLLLALIFLPYLPRYQHLEHVAILAFILMVIFGLWLCQFLHWVAHQHEGAQLRQVCQNNRKQLYT